MLLHRRRIVLMVLGTLVVASNAGAQTAPAAITRIRERYDRIQNGLSKLRAVKMTADEGADAEAIAYYDGTQLRKVLCRGLYAGAPVQHYYFWNNQVIFVLDSRPPETAPNQPARQNRFYFDNGKLIRWVDAAGNPVQAGSKAFIQYQKDFRRTGDYWLKMTRGRDFTHLEVSRGVVPVAVQ